MPSIWETSLPDADADLYANAITKEDWEPLLADFFPDDASYSYDTFWDDHGGFIEDNFNYENKFGANESLARRSYTKGLESYTNSMYGKIKEVGKKRGMQGFAGSGSGLGLQKNNSNLWNDYQLGLTEKKGDLNNQMLGYKNQFKDDFLGYMGDLAAGGIFEG